MGQGGRGSTTFSFTLCREAGSLDYLALDAFAVIVQDEDPVDSGQGQRLLRSRERWRVAHGLGKNTKPRSLITSQQARPAVCRPGNTYPPVTSSPPYHLQDFTAVWYSINDVIRYGGLALAWANKMILIIAHLTTVDLTSDVTQEFIANSGAVFPPTPVYCSVKVTCPVCFTPI